MRIGLFTDTYYPEINGVATSTKMLKLGLEELGHEVYVIAPDNKQFYIDEPTVIRKRSMPFILLKDRRLCVFNTRRAMKQLQAFNFDIIHSQTEFVIGHLARITARRYNIPFVHTYHTVYEDYTHYFKIPGKNSEFVKNIVRKASKTLCNKADTLIVPTNKVKDLLRSYHITKDIYVQPTGIDYNKFSNPCMDKVAELKSKYNISSNNKILVTAGRMSKEKNVIELINFLPSIIEKQPDTILVVIGDGPERNNLVSQVNKLNLQNNVIFTGAVPWSEMENYYALGDIFICGSTSETQGLTYIEALACGKPILVRYDDCLKDVLVQGIDGYGYTNKDEFVQGYFDICKNYDSMKEESYKVAHKYSNIVFAENILKIYKNSIK